MNEVIAYLRDELAKRKAPWVHVDEKGKAVWKEQLYTPIILMPNQVQALLRGIDAP